MAQAIADELERKAVITRTAALVCGWDISDAEALLKVAPTPVHIDLCIQSMMIHVIHHFRHEDEMKIVEDYVADHLGLMASYTKGGYAALDKVLINNVPWLRLLELAWICQSRAVMHLLIRDPLARHPFAKSIILPISELYKPVQRCWWL
jgi:hypothetical protein